MADRQAVVILDGEPAGDGPRRPRLGGIALVAVAIAGAALGYLAGSTAGPRVPGDAGSLGTAAAAPATSAPRPQHDPDPAVASPPAPAPATTPRQLLPGFDGTILAATDDSLLWWNPAMAAPDTYALPSGADAASVTWDAAGEWVAFTTYFPEQPILWVGRTRSSQYPAFIGVHRRAPWHASEPGHLAWIGTDPTAAAPSLYAGTASSSGVSYRPVSGLPEDPDSLDAYWELVAWGEWGFAINRYDERGFDDPEITATVQEATAITLAADGSVLGERAGARIETASAGGIIVVTDENYGTGESRSWLSATDLETVADPAFSVDPVDAWTLSFSLEDGYAVRRTSRAGIAVGAPGSEPETYALPPVVGLAWSRDGYHLAFLPESSDRIGLLDLATGRYALLDPDASVHSVRLR